MGTRRNIPAKTKRSNGERDWRDRRRSVREVQGLLIIGSFPYREAYGEHLFQYNYFVIGLDLTAFGAGDHRASCGKGCSKDRSSQHPELWARLGSIG